MDKLLNSIYFDVNNPASYGSLQKLYKSAKKENEKITFNDVKEWAKSNLTYTLHYPARRYFERNKIIVSGPHEQGQADLVDMTQFSSMNNGYKYILTFIDVFSKEARALPLKAKTQKEVAAAINKILSEYEVRKLQTDRGTEFTNKQVEDVVETNFVDHFFTNNQDIKAAVIERFNRTIKSKIYKYFTAKGTRKWITVLPMLLSSYNNTVHRTIGVAPSKVTEENQDEIFEKVYGYPNERELRKAILMKDISKAKLQVDDVVRLRYYLPPMEHRFHPNYTDRLFIVASIVKGDPGIMYKLKSVETGELIDGTFYGEELQLVKESLYRIEKIIQRRGNRVLVKWLGYPNEFNSWIQRSELQEVGE